MSDKDGLNELDELFFKRPCDPSTRKTVLTELLGLSGSIEGCKKLTDSDLLVSLIQLCQSPADRSKLIYDILVNISSVDGGSAQILKHAEADFVPSLIDEVTQSNSWCDSAVQLLTNLTRSPDTRDTVVSLLQPIDVHLVTLSRHFKDVTNRQEERTLDHVAMVFCNLSCHSLVRSYLLEGDKELFISLLPFTDFENSSVRRSGIIKMIKNLCFETAVHGTLLKDVEILPRLLLPLAGGEEFDDEDTEKLPLELQYLEETKQREPEPEIRKDVLETLNKLCTTKSGREFLRDANSYVILREYHKWEKNRELLLACENVVDILIRTEDEIGKDDLDAEVPAIPEDMIEKFNKMDNEFIAE